MAHGNLLFGKNPGSPSSYNVSFRFGDGTEYRSLQSGLGNQ